MAPILHDMSSYSPSDIEPGIRHWAHHPHPSATHAHLSGRPLVHAQLIPRAVLIVRPGNLAQPPEQAMSVPAGPPDLSRVVGKIRKQLSRTFADADAPRARGVVGTIINVPAAYWGKGFAASHKGQHFPVRVVGFVQGTVVAKDRWYFWDHHPEDEDEHGCYPIAGRLLKRCQRAKPAAKKKSAANKKPAAKKPAAKKKQKPAAKSESPAKSKSAATKKTVQKRKRVSPPTCLAEPGGPSIRDQFAAKARTQVSLQQRRCGTRRSSPPARTRPPTLQSPRPTPTHTAARKYSTNLTHTRAHTRGAFAFDSDTGKSKHISSLDVESDLDMVDGLGIASR